MESVIYLYHQPIWHSTVQRWNETIKLLQAEKTPELMSYMDQISGVVNYVNQTFSLFSEVEKVRPKKLLCNKKDKT
ncbi:MAG: hypothetical protein E6Q26_07040 [Acinetobacter sp.]|nr:MAG: hypothetical protein E6Q26_07040 [Acinetobacter sp.]